MGAKLERLGAELAKARKKKAEWDSRVKDLERRYREEENSEIHEMVHAANLTPDQLSELLKMFAEDSAPKPETIQSVTEEETTHENYVFGRYLYGAAFEHRDIFHNGICLCF